MASVYERFITQGLEKHAVAGSTRLLATNGGKHIYSVKIGTDLDNGSILAKDAWVAFEYYSAKDSTGFAGVIVDQAANGNWYVEVTEPGDALLVLQVPMIYDEHATALTHESNFFNEAGDIVRCYELAKGDIFELSKEGFSGEPVKGATVSVTNKQVTVG